MNAYQYLLPLTLAAFSLGLAFGCAAAEPAAAPQQTTRMTGLMVYIGTYTGPNSKGIYRYRMDLATGTLSDGQLVAEVTNPTFLAIHPNRRFLYAVGEMGQFQGKPAGAVSAFAVSPTTGKLTLLNQQPSGGRGPCHLTVDAEGKNVLVANYGGGSAAVLPVNEDGRLAEPMCVVQHNGSGPNPKRQEGPHAHSVNLDPAGRFALVADLGLDKVMVYRFDDVKGTLTPNEPPFASVAPGAGPRHLAFHPNGRLVYVINEMGGTVTAFAYDAPRGALSEIQTIPTLPADFKGDNTTAQVLVHPAGKFVYGSNRGHDSIAIFAVDQTTGRLTLIGFQLTQGKNPRNFQIDPTGQYLLAANQSSNNVVVFSIDQNTGQLKPTGCVVDVNAPVCVKFLPVY